MTTITLKEMQKNIDQVFSQALKDNDVYTIATDGGALVLVSEKEWNEMKETLQLLKDKESLSSLIEGHHRRLNGEKPESVTPDEAFYDLQN